jgi:hypothetical protein
MDKLIIDATDKTPYILLDPTEGLIQVKGISDEEDALGFYFPVLQWLDTYQSHAPSHTKVELEFKYYNTASSKSLYEVLKRVAQLKKHGKDVDVTWYLDQEDEHMLSEIENFSDITHLPIQAVEK